MKKIENNFTVTGFVGNNAEIRQFTTASVARFSLAVSRQEKNGEETNRVSAFISMEAWRKNEHTESFDQLTKGTLLTVEGYFKPDEWIDQQGTKHNRIVFIANKFYPAVYSTFIKSFSSCTYYVPRFIISQKYFVPTVLASVASTTDATKGKTIAPKVYAETHLP